MKPLQAKKLALELMKQHDLSGWKFDWSRAKTQFGRCNFPNQKIFLSKPLTALNEEAQVKDTILHEIAHAMVGIDAGHGWRWKAKAKEIGCNAQRCVSNAITPEGKYRYACWKCGYSFTSHKKLKRRKACADCCNLYAGGRFSEHFEMKEIKQ